MGTTINVYVSPPQCDTAVHQEATINAILVQKVSNDIFFVGLAFFFLSSKQLQATNTSVTPPQA